MRKDGGQRPIAGRSKTHPSDIRPLPVREPGRRHGERRETALPRAENDNRATRRPHGEGSIYTTAAISFLAFVSKSRRLS